MVAAFTWDASIDSKGRITIPSRIRDRLGISKREEISVSITSERILRKEVENTEDALEALSEMESVKSFRCRDGVLEVVKDV